MIKGINSYIKTHQSGLIGISKGANINDANRVIAADVREELIRLKSELAVVKRAITVDDYDGGLRAKFDPDQPRIPAGSPHGGRWMGSSVEDVAVGDVFNTFAAARRAGRPWKYCAAQYAVDGLLCNSLEPASTRASCWRQARRAPRRPPERAPDPTHELLSFTDAHCDPLTWTSCRRKDHLI